MPEGKNITLFCNLEKEQVIWKINQTYKQKDFQSSHNSTLIISNRVLDGTLGGVFIVQCMANNSNVTDRKIYRVHLTKGIIDFVYIYIQAVHSVLFNSFTQWRKVVKGARRKNF